MPPERLKMSIEQARHEAMRRAFQYRRPAYLVLDILVCGLRIFLGPHPEYLDSEPNRFFPIAIYHPEGLVESAIG
jgi:hypothetical protein